MYRFVFGVSFSVVIAGARPVPPFLAMFFVLRYCYSHLGSPVGREGGGEGFMGISWCQLFLWEDIRIFSFSLLPSFGVRSEVIFLGFSLRSRCSHKYRLDILYAFSCSGYSWGVGGFASLLCRSHVGFFT